MTERDAATSRLFDWDRIDDRSKPADSRVRAAVALGVSKIVGVAGVVWAGIYLAVGTPLAALYPGFFTVASMSNAWVNRSSDRVQRFVAIQLALMGVVPLALMFHLGGLAASAAVGLWSLIAPLGALMVFGSTVATRAFVAFAISLAAGAVADGRLTPVEQLPERAIGPFLLLDTVVVGFAAFWVLREFLVANGRLVAEQERLREVERAYVQQEAMLRQQERLATLGRMSAGVAHELNNPAAAAGRASRQLADVVDRVIDDAVALLGQGIGPDGVAWVREKAHDPDVGALELSDREERLATRLEVSGVEDAWELAGPLAELGFDASSFDAASERYSRLRLVATLRWIADVDRAHRLVGEVQGSARRISEVVKALKGYSHMDGADETTFDVRDGIRDTLVILKDKLRDIEIDLAFEDIPTVTGQQGEMNQVWTNLIANAAEAIDGPGTITIATYVAGDVVRVEVADDGPGIPPDVIGQVFDPFVTTKAPGEGTGLGLNISHQIVVDRHRGAIRVDSVPGRTRFVVDLPISTSS